MANRIIEYTKSDAMLPQSLQIFAPQHIEKESLQHPPNCSVLIFLNLRILSLPQEFQLSNALFC